MDQRNQAIAAAFDERAPGYRDSDWHRASAERLVDLCGLGPGDRVLDAGTGTGFAALHAARQVGGRPRGRRGHLAGDAFRGAGRGGGIGVANIEFIQCDATALAQFPDAVRCVTCATSLIYIPVV